MIEIQLTRGFVAKVDEADFDTVRAYKWRAFVDNRTCYAATGGWKNRPFLLMHRLILGAERGRIVDHVNGDGLDNRRENLRFCTVSENGANRRKNSGVCSSKYKGVTWHKALSKWKVSIQVQGESLHGGYFLSEESAAEAYRDLARHHFGRFAGEP